MEKIIENAVYRNCSRWPGNMATVKVESYKYESPVQLRTAIYVEYFRDVEQFKKLWRHNGYMDEEKFYIKVGRKWVAANI